MRTVTPSLRFGSSCRPTQPRSRPTWKSKAPGESAVPVADEVSSPLADDRPQSAANGRTANDGRPPRMERGRDHGCTELDEILAIMMAVLSGRLERPPAPISTNTRSGDEQRLVVDQLSEEKFVVAADSIALDRSDRVARTGPMVHGGLMRDGHPDPESSLASDQGSPRLGRRSAVGVHDLDGRVHDHGSRRARR